MIIDTSALVALVRVEPDADRFFRALSDTREPKRMSAANWLEAASSTGALSAKMTALEIRQNDLQEQNTRQLALIEALQAENKALKREPAPA